MSLARALESLSADRATVSAARSVVRFFDAHRREHLDLERIARATGADADLVRTVLGALQAGYVIDCGGPGSSCTFDPNPVLEIEVARYLRTSSAPTSRLRESTDRFRNRYGRGY